MDRKAVAARISSGLGLDVPVIGLAFVDGALGRYLRAHGSPTEGVELRVGCPVSMRRPEERGTLGNIVTTIIVPLYVGINDPLARLAAQRAAMDRLKQEDQAGALHALARATRQIPPGWLMLGAQVDAPNTLINTFATNVPGPQVPLYLAGRQVRAMYLLGPLGANLGLFNAILSYNQQLTITATVDPTRMPDVWFYIDCLHASFAELREAAAHAPAA